MIRKWKNMKVTRKEDNEDNEEEEENEREGMIRKRKKMRKRRGELGGCLRSMGIEEDKLRGHFFSLFVGEINEKFLYSAPTSSSSVSLD